MRDDGPGMSIITITLTGPDTGDLATRLPRVLALRGPGALTTFYYRTTGGTRGSTRAVASRPAGAVIERTATS